MRQEDIIDSSRVCTSKDGDHKRSRERMVKCRKNCAIEPSGTRYAVNGQLDNQRVFHCYRLWVSHVFAVRKSFTSEVDPKFAISTLKVKHKRKLTKQDCLQGIQARKRQK